MGRGAAGAATGGGAPTASCGPRHPAGRLHLVAGPSGSGRTAAGARQRAAAGGLLPGQGLLAHLIPRHILASVGLPGLAGGGKALGEQAAGGPLLFGSGGLPELQKLLQQAHVCDEQPSECRRRCAGVPPAPRPRGGAATVAACLRSCWAAQLCVPAGCWLCTLLGCQHTWTSSAGGALQALQADLTCRTTRVPPPPARSPPILPCWPLGLH